MHMTSHDNVTDIERRYLLQKRGLYYRPDRCGYTGIKEHAGRYSEHEASLPDVVAIHEDEAADFSPSCYDDLARQHLQEQIATLRKQLENAQEALRPFALAAQKGSNVYAGVQMAMKDRPDLFSYSTAYIDAGRSTAHSHLSWNDYVEAKEAYEALKGQP